MALKVNEVLIRNQEYLRDPAEFRRTLEHVERIIGLEPEAELHQEPGSDNRPRGDARRRHVDLLQRAAGDGREERRRDSELPGPGHARKDAHRQGDDADRRKAGQGQGGGPPLRLLFAQRQGRAPWRPQGHQGLAEVHDGPRRRGELRPAGARSSRRSWASRPSLPTWEKYTTCDG